MSATDTDTLTRPATPQTGSGKPARAHIARADEVTEAYVTGNQITALCGYKWVPTRDPAGLPVCPDCKAIALQMTGGSLPEG